MRYFGLSALLNLRAFPTSNARPRRNGVRYCDRPPGGPTDEDMRASRTSTSLSLAETPSSKRIGHGNTKDAYKVLSFSAYFVEPVYESRVEQKRVRKLEVLFYCEDGTMQICEGKTDTVKAPAI